jgi:hypothetical protein
LLSGSSGLLFPEEPKKDRDILLTPDSGDAWASWAVGECIQIIAPSSLKVVWKEGESKCANMNAGGVSRVR